ncbi:Butyryl-CoA dehydrogenase [Pseudonocardia sp. Ae168_Ps1]|uniref:acyl-CoA dehydrogenase family protein n=1 Tax=unclassified Pseudonocardia TaxID=2619320 RepID=UPI00094B0D96|nr:MULTISPECIES: acyl-CoA dehydrogenase family protein [unclassified Pseudonocardia]OLL72725.1 Butyryl-CoA dehydrogenase [Pseudonocardia sp. Ae150A_Ps1]OLL76032.1 Butyryl-CoA dehydrogenase [Pseudonocardia sp. Ae150A_Ps1]OLL78696.1 Butyryl-CoA dehydrogenase [Pseudonocardia sp. Ae168_Ps1]OLL82031.1 Butyryl-CoA dehydrogenase [Pseudonocardia sp. Ae168_Ps1]OLL83856.1 Butyryl-CoA dehydrogenase [Pseudonocardia sp. Ae263_Ps1]
MRRTLYESDHEDFRSAFRAFVDKEVAPHGERWTADGIVPRELFTTAGANGFLGMDVPESYGGGGVPDFRFNAVVIEELMDAGAGGLGLGMTLHNDIVIPYLLAYGSDEQKQRWLPDAVSGNAILAIAMTEPGTGSDLASMTTTAVREGDHYVVNGAKTFITNGINADLVVVAVKTDPSQKHKGMSLLVLERGMEGFERGRNLDKLGQHAQDTAELSFTDVRVPVGNLLGPDEGQGFAQLVQKLPQERLSIALAGVSAARAALRWTLEYVKERKAFGSPIGSFQNSKFVLAELDTEIDIAEHYVDDCVRALNAGELTAVDASKAKYWCTELQGRVVDKCLQLHGGYGYMSEYPISTAYADARITRIYGGTTEIMKEVIGRGLGL